jgi:SAM-dependent methyltransferase
MYQDDRDNDLRWELIKPHIQERTTILDIGCNQGYFARKCAQVPGTVVWAIDHSEKHARYVAENSPDNVLVSLYDLHLADFCALARSCELVDMTLMLSVLHHFPVCQQTEILNQLSYLSRTVIFEFAVEPIDTLYPQPVDKLVDDLNHLFDTVEYLGDSELGRPLYKCDQHNIFRPKATSYIGGEKSHRHIVGYSEATWHIDGRTELEPGFNTYNLYQSGLIKPSIDQILDSAATQYLALISSGIIPTDMRLWNILLTHRGTKPIDYHEGANTDYLDMSWDEYTKTIRSLDHKGIKNRIIDNL